MRGTLTGQRYVDDILRPHDSSMAGPLPDLSKSCHSVHDLELAVQDLWTDLPQYKWVCLINSMPDRVATCVLQLEVVQHAIEAAQYLCRCTPCIRLIVLF
ncbi:hypothetical protein TNCV_2104261 [Trichonephila clavipes]|nr:hypothetical protein TNCV_2104261 [Trichonephila clavipes]